MYACCNSCSVDRGFLATISANLARSFHLIAVCTEPVFTASGITPICFFNNSLIPIYLSTYVIHTHRSRLVDAPSLPRYAFNCSRSEPQHPTDARNKDSIFAILLCGISVTNPQSAINLVRWCIDAVQNRSAEKKKPHTAEVY